MRKISFLSKVAVIFNIIYFVELLLRFKIILRTFHLNIVGLWGGWFLAPVFNLALLISLALIKKKGDALPVKKYVWVFCLFCLFFQTVLFLFND